MKSISIIAMLFTIVYATSCKKESENTDFANSANCTGVTPVYTGEIASIINSNCATSGCHGGGSSAAGINLSNYSNASNQFKNNNDNLASIHHASGVEAMPRGASKLSDAVINKLDCWVKNGCPQ
jgi:hypothetical protein